jgi:hypothetical protein
MSSGPLFTGDDPLTDEELAAIMQFQSDEDGLPPLLDPVDIGDATPVPPSLEQVHETFKRWLFMPDLTALDIAMATYIAHRGGQDPVWSLLIGAPSSGKTEVLPPCTDCPRSMPSPA